MSANVQPAERAAPLAEGQVIINDFQIVVGTINGTGSQTANTTLIRALFNMGIPVNGKNIFPSNMHGLPTWFYIRLSKDGYIARRERFEIVVAMNRATAEEDIAGVASGGMCLYPEEWGLRHDRDDIVYYPMPVKEFLVQNKDIPPKLKDYVQNMAYVGTLAAILDIDLGEIRAALDYHFAGKAKPIKMNMDMVQVAYDYSKANHVKRDPFRAERLNKTQGMILLDGNSAGALGAIFGGMTFTAWYPITPSTSLVDALREYAEHMRHDPATGKATYSIIQAEDELAAIGMVLGAGWAGARSMTSTSGPGVSLMGEFSGLGYYAEIPGVIFDIQRVGPSTGLPTRTMQGDILSTAVLSHGDTKHILLLPCSVEECFTMAGEAFDLAGKYKTPGFVMSDLDLGMNNWMSDPFPYPEKPIARGKVLTAADLD